MSRMLSLKALVKILVLTIAGTLGMGWMTNQDQLNWHTLVEYQFALLA